MARRTSPSYATWHSTWCVAKAPRARCQKSSGGPPGATASLPVCWLKFEVRLPWVRARLPALGAERRRFGAVTRTETAAGSRGQCVGPGRQRVVGQDWQPLQAKQIVDPQAAARTGGDEHAVRANYADIGPRPLGRVVIQADQQIEGEQRA